MDRYSPHVVASKSYVVNREETSDILLSRRIFRTVGVFFYEFYPPVEAYSQLQSTHEDEISAGDIIDIISMLSEILADYLC